MQGKCEKKSEFFCFFLFFRVYLAIYFISQNKNTMPEQNIDSSLSTSVTFTPETSIPSGTEIPKGDTPITPETDTTTNKGNIFLEEGKNPLSSNKMPDDDIGEQGNQITTHIRIFIIFSILTVINIIII